MAGPLTRRNRTPDGRRPGGGDPPRGLAARVAAVGLGVGLGVGFGYAAGTGASASPYIGLDVYARVLARIEESYVAPVDQQALVWASLRGMAASLDPHSEFFPPAAWARLEAEAGGTYVGAGVTTEDAPCGRRVTQLVADGPAALADVTVGDCIVAVDGAALAGRGDALLRGVDGQAVRWIVTSVPTPGRPARREVALLYRPVRAPSVTTSEPAPGVVCLHLTRFDGTTAAEVAAALTRRHATGPIAAILLDLRDNPGGRLDQAVATVDLFLTEGPIVTTTGRGPGATHAWIATASADDEAGPLRVLVNAASASAAEVVAGALQDRGRARLVGAPTYGKGTVQSLFHFEDGSALKLTDARYTLPSGRGLADRSGLVPDVPAPEDPLAAALADLGR